jgi:hypothetical protein
VHAKQGGGGANGVRGGEGGGGGLRFCTPFCPSERDARRPARKRECAGSLAGTGRGPRGIPFPPCPLFARRPCLQTGEGWGTPRCAGAGIARGPRSCAAGTSHSYTREEKRVYNMRRARRTVRACPLLTPLPLLGLHATPPICRGGHKGGGALPCSCTRPNGNECTRKTRGRARIWRECAGEGGACGHRICTPFCPSSRVALNIFFQAVDGGHAGEWGAAGLRERGRGNREKQGQPCHALTIGACFARIF